MERLTLKHEHLNPKTLEVEETYEASFTVPSIGLYDFDTKERIKAMFCGLGFSEKTVERFFEGEN